MGRVLPDQNPPRLTKGKIWAAGAIIVVAVVGAYHGTLTVPFMFDDVPAIVENESIRNLGAWREVLSPPATSAGAVGRPLVNLSLALNYAVGGLDVRGYHALNVLLHLLAGLTFFGLARRTFQLPACGGLFEHRHAAEAQALPLAGVTALVWAVHPLLTESVTSVIQRDEVLATLLLFFVIYAFVRGVESSSRRPWFVAAITANLLGMAAKEIMVAAPILVLLYDRAFIAGSFRVAWRERRWVHGALAGGWLFLAWMMIRSQGRNSTVGFALGVDSASYALTQCWAIVQYLWLALWPFPLVFDYGTDFFTTLDAALVFRAVILAALCAGFLWATWRRPALGFLGAWFFLILAPSSSVVPLITQAVAEHRMYAPLAAVVTLGVIGAHVVNRQRAWLAIPLLAAALAVTTIARNEDYRSEVALWRDTATKFPTNARAHYNLGNAQRRAGDLVAALNEYDLATRLVPKVIHARLNRADVLEQLGRRPEAIAEYEAALRADSRSATAHHNFAVTLVRAGRANDAVIHFLAALQFETEATAAKTHFELADTLADLNRLPEAVTHYEAALRSGPGSALLHSNLGSTLYKLGQIEAACRQFEQAVRLDPNHTAAHANFGVALVAAGNFPAAVRELEAARRLAPDNEAIRAILASAQAKLPP